MTLQELKTKSGDFLLLKKNILKTFEPRKDVLDANIKYWLKNKELIALKKGNYILREKYEKEPNKDLYLEYLANQLIQPSYLSLEHVLAKYQLLSEPVLSFTSMTTQTTREIINDLGVFRYYSITPELFIDYKMKKFSSASVWEAEKSKALFDFLYLRFLRNETLNQESLENLRINWENISNKEFKKAYSYVKLTKSKKLKRAFQIIQDSYYA